MDDCKQGDSNWKKAFIIDSESIKDEFWICLASTFEEISVVAMKYIINILYSRSTFALHKTFQKVAYILLQRNYWMQSQSQRKKNWKLIISICCCVCVTTTLMVMIILYHDDDQWLNDYASWHGSLFPSRVIQCTMYYINGHIQVYYT